MIYGNSVGGVGLERTYILVDEKGNEYPATFVDNETEFDATANDIRLGKVAATGVGVVTGEKDIPAYHTTEGIAEVSSGETIEILMFSDKCNYTKLQALICAFNTTLNDSVATEKVAFNNKVYAVNSTESIADITVDTIMQSISFGITNDSENPIVVRFMTYKEEV